VFLVTELSNGALETLWVAMAMALEANQEPMWILVLMCYYIVKGCGTLQGLRWKFYHKLSPKQFR
jgi:hypothetical protein